MGGQGGGEAEEVKKRKRGREQERSDTKGKKRGRDGWRDRRTEWKEGEGEVGHCGEGERGGGGGGEGEPLVTHQGLETKRPAVLSRHSSPSSIPPSRTNTNFLLTRRKRASPKLQQADK